MGTQIEHPNPGMVNYQGTSASKVKWRKGMTLDDVLATQPPGGEWHLYAHYIYPLDRMMDDLDHLSGQLLVYVTADTLGHLLLVSERTEIAIGPDLYWLNAHEHQIALTASGIQSQPPAYGGGGVGGACQV